MGGQKIVMGLLIAPLFFLMIFIEGIFHDRPFTI